MTKYTAAEASVELGLDDKGKTLRKLLREDPAHTFTAPGSGASWSFSTGDMPALRRLVETHNNKPRGSKTAKTTVIRDDKGLPWRVAMTDKRAVKALSIERVDRLEQALLAAGLHISQMNVFGDDRRALVASELVAV